MKDRNYRQLIAGRQQQQQQGCVERKVAVPDITVRTVSIIFREVSKSSLFQHKMSLTAEFDSNTR
jgi:hypothetical protein